ncbi:disease resistance protein ADR1-like [Prosopis cineraria]|uniref:disease resistance protein ADR1-like n=1 Tax=Prosopis cineraria TaxID=364024 RepID=UPI00240EA852|nr:disease resistance protein ADR1-like [Prosopis cineraria]
MAPSYQEELENAHNEIARLLTVWGAAVTTVTVLQDRADRLRDTVPSNDNIRRAMFKNDHETMSSKFTVGWNSPLMTNLKSSLMRDGGDRILNLTGFTDSGKTTLARQLCHDIDVRGWFSDNIHFVPECSKIESDGDLAKQMEREWSNEMSSNTKSKILVISKDTLQGLGIPVQMTPLREEDAIALLRHFVQPSGTTSYTFLPDNDTLLRVVQVCGCYPMAIKIIGRDLQGQPIEFWQKKLKQWSKKGHTDTELLAHLRRSLSIELYQEVEDDIDAMIHIHYLTNMNLAEVVRRRIGSDEDNYYKNHFLTQHSILKELANKYSIEQGEAFERKRLIVEISGNEPPERWQQKQPQ